jgi:hypothetical protein
MKEARSMAGCVDMKDAFIAQFLAPWFLLVVLTFVGIPVQWLVRRYMPEGRLKRLLFRRFG